jgi:hypothetical protein
VQIKIDNCTKIRKLDKILMPLDGLGEGEERYAEE